MNAKIITPRERKIVLENFFSLSTLQSINYLLPVIVLPYLIRVIGPEKFGLIAFAQAFIQYFMIFTDYGFSLSATRKISLCREHKDKVCEIFSSVMTVKIVLAFISFLILLAVVHFVPKFKDDWLIFVLSFGAVIGNTLFPVWFFQGTEKMKYISIVNIIGGITYAVCIFIFVRGPGDYLYVPALNSIFFLVTGLSGLHIAFRKFGIEFIVQSYADIKQELKTGWNIFISVVAINAYTATRIFAVGLLTNNILTGYYAIAEKMANIVQAFPLDSLSQAMYPRLSKIFARNKTRAIKIMNKLQASMTVAYVISVPLIFIMAPLVVKLVCGQAYEEVITALRLLLLGVFFVGANAFRVQFLLVGGRADIYSKLHVAAALVGLPLIFLLIRYFSYLGAAVATIATEIGILILTLRIVKDLIRKNFRS